MQILPILIILVTLGMGHSLALTYKMVCSFYLSTHSVFLIYFFYNVIFSIAKSIDFTLKIFEICYGGVVDTFLASPLKMVYTLKTASTISRPAP